MIRNLYLEAIFKVKEEREENEKVIIKNLLERKGVISETDMLEEYLNTSVYNLISQLGNPLL